MLLAFFLWARRCVLALEGHKEHFWGQLLSFLWPPTPISFFKSSVLISCLLRFPKSEVSFLQIVHFCKLFQHRILLSLTLWQPLIFWRAVFLTALSVRILCADALAGLSYTSVSSCACDMYQHVCEHPALCDITIAQMEYQLFNWNSLLLASTLAWQKKTLNKVRHALRTLHVQMLT